MLHGGATSSPSWTFLDHPELILDILDLPGPSWTGLRIWIRIRILIWATLPTTMRNAASRCDVPAYPGHATGSGWPVPPTTVHDAAWVQRAPPTPATPLGLDLDLRGLPSCTMLRECR